VQGCNCFSSRKRAKSSTVFRMAGPLTDARVPDLVCDLGFYSRLLKQHGAAQAIGADGQEVLRPSWERGVVFQEHALFPWHTVHQHISFGLEMKGVPRL
jgi:hypothetical protein